MMSQLILNIDEQLETALNERALKEGKSITEVIINVVQSVIRQNPSTNVKKLEPFLHSTPIQYQVLEDLSDVKPFAHVTDSAKFGKALREKAWHRTEVVND
jgi:hypothetical protein